jgi:hypothetical protein
MQFTFLLFAASVLAASGPVNDVFLLHRRGLAQWGIGHYGGVVSEIPKPASTQEVQALDAASTSTHTTRFSTVTTSVTLSRTTVTVPSTTLTTTAEATATVVRRDGIM